MKFFDKLQPITSLEDVTDESRFIEVPEHWLVAASDVKGSTEAVNRGKYKDVNTVAAAVVAAVQNATKGTDVPFIFGGDGASAVFPPEYRQAVAEALAGARKLSRDAFDLELRVGIVPVKKVLKDGYSIKVARILVSEQYTQSAFIGGGLSHAEDLLKDESENFLLEESTIANADFSGFECRWGEIDTHKDETVSIIVKAQKNAPNDIYGRILKKISVIYGDRQERHPLHIKNLRLTFNPLAQQNETAVKTGSKGLVHSTKRAVTNMLAEIRFRFNGNWGNITWDQYKMALIASTDHEKFDDTLRMVISSTKAQHEQLKSYLEDQYQQRNIYYGTYSSHAALVTCIVYDKENNHVHFLDGAGGGYVNAAKQFKKQMKAAH